MKSIIVTVSPEGEVEIKAAGFRGASCEKATAALEKALGTVKSKTHTPEFFQAQEQQQKQGN